jgi:hypothetical protein
MLTNAVVIFIGSLAFIGMFAIITSMIRDNDDDITVE